MLLLTISSHRKIKIIGAAALSLLTLAFAGTLVLWFGREGRAEGPKSTSISTFRDLSSLVGRIIKESNQDSLTGLARSFEQNYYEGQLIYPEDSVILLTMRRFKFELNDKLSGMTNILDSEKFQNVGRDLIAACQLQMTHLTKTPQQAGKNYYSASSAGAGR
jgi:hypothetical protein